MAMMMITTTMTSEESADCITTSITLLVVNLKSSSNNHPAMLSSFRASPLDWICVWVWGWVGGWCDLVREKSLFVRLRVCVCVGWLVVVLPWTP